MPRGISADWNTLMSAARRRLRDPKPKPVIVLPCEMVLTIAPRSNGRRLTVRCRCMAGTHHVPASRYYVYDPIGEAAGIDAAKALWDSHREEVAARAAAGDRVG